MYIYIHIHIYMNTYTYIHIYVYIYICIYIYTYIHVAVFFLGRPSCRSTFFCGTDDPRLPTYLSTYEKLPTTEVSLYWATIIKQV